jgi:hypothetical protein
MITETFKKNRPDLSQGSIRTYTSIINNLAKQMKIVIEKPDDVIKHHKEIINHLKEVPPKNRKTRLSALVVFIDKEAHGKDAVTLFRQQMTEDGKVADEEADEQKLTERQKEGMMSYDDVMKMYRVLEQEVSPLLKRTSLDKKQFARVQMYVILSCLLLIQPRRSTDYTEFKLREIDPEADNFMKTEKRKPYFVFNKYKTAHKYKQQKEEIPSKLKTIITAWEKLNPHDWLLMNSKQTGKINPTQLTHLLYAFFEKPISTSLLRHIYLSSKYGNINLKEMKEDAERMGHSVAEQMKYVKH